MKDFNFGDGGTDFSFMHNQKIKNFKMILIIAIAVLAIVIVSVIIYGCIGKSDNKSIPTKQTVEYNATTSYVTPSDSEWRYYGPGSVYLKNYAASDTFLITTQSVFDTFIKTVNMGFAYWKDGYIDHIDYYYTYEGKTVILGVDVEINSLIDDGYFMGVLDGNGHTISGKSYVFKSQGTYLNTGIFHVLYGTVKNTKFSDFNFHIGANFGTDYFLSVVAGTNEGLIENCIIENCKFTSDTFNSDAFCAPITSFNKGRVENCLVAGYYKIGGYNTNGMFNPDGINAYPFVISGNDAVYCVTSATKLKIGYDALENEVKKQEFKDKYVLFHNENKDGKAFPTTCCNSKDNISNIRSYCSSVGGRVVGNTPWYHAAEYADMPYLRYFMNWKEIKFRSEDTSKGTVDTEYILVPEDAAVGGTRGGHQTLKILGQEIRASMKTDEYKIQGWEWASSDNSYTLRFAADLTLIYFYGTNTTSRVSIWKYNMDVGQFYTIVKGSLIEVNVEYYANGTIKSIGYDFTAIVDNRYKHCQITFYGYYYGGDFDTATYYLKHNQNNKENKTTSSFHATDDYITDVAGKLAIRIHCPTAVKKSYGIEVK